MLALLGLLALLATAVPLAAEERPSLYQSRRLLPAAEADSFGVAVALDGDTAAVGASSEDGWIDEAGAVYVFARDGEDWLPVAHLQVEGSDHLGDAVAVDGDTLLAGASFTDLDGLARGAAYVFARDADGEPWGLVAELTAGDAEDWDKFGQAVALHGDSAAVGAPAQYLFDIDDDPGAVYVFARDPAGPAAWTETAKLTASDGTPGSAFGFALAMDGDEIVVGAPTDDTRGFDAGAAYVFRRDPLDPSAWTEVAKLTASDGDAEDAFGTGVALDGDTIVVGASQYLPHRDGSGAVYTFRRDRSDPLAWEEVSKLVPADAEYGDAFGEAVDLVGSALLVGAPQRGPGWVYLYRRSTVAPELWRRIAKVKPADADVDDPRDFGIAVALGSDGTVIAGDRLAYPEGKAYVFRPILVDPHSTLSGSCPGRVTLATEGLTPNGLGSIYSAPEPGDAVLGGSPCVGTELGLGAPVVYVDGGRAGPDGTDSTLLDVDASDCGHYLQLIDLTSCAVANVVRSP